MRVFLSWSGERSRAVAQLLHIWLPEFIQSLKPWMAEKDIDPGEHFHEILNQTLSQIDFGILCLTKDNYKAPWVLFEAGALARAVKTVETTEDRVVCPYLIDLDPQSLADPLKDLQAVYADERGTYRLLQRINQAYHPDARLKEERLRASFVRCWGEFDARLSRLLNRLGPSNKADEFYIVNKGSNKCLQPGGGANGNSIAIAAFKGKAIQRWSFHEVDPDLFAIRSTFSQKCLDVKEKRKEPGAEVHQWEFVGEPQQKWRMEESEDGSYRFQNVNSGHYLGISDSALKQLGYDENAEQRWWLQPSFIETVESYP